ncbi:hypothetical protein LTR78_006199 [Recurvomyces mirabilis]|uniref:Uncharacterized protein n=1 Tax=Recurvomyces mirabilis TaxID=574656 RepID=A0AAE0WLM2_9PEZI|nr:hypothetical protein LTR78_006199 [Recurvomyces mirabilis]KAK5152040.1 hypothetical protein LTS14_008814 [Recurvomyces mirabilis]
MLNTKALTELLSLNTDERLCKRWYLMTPSGTLLASSQPTDAKDLRKQVAFATLSWQEHLSGEELAEHGQAEQRGPDRGLQTLSIETEAINVVVRKLQPHLLLVLEGGVPPRKRSFMPRTTAEGRNGELLQPARTAESSLAASLSSQIDLNVTTAPSSVLALHKKKLEAMAAAILADFERTGFKMPGEDETGLF